ncbi:MAG: hypothetical protein RMJ37_05710 [Spirochaetia bacterium]|nr:hypothetical protein [Spirochaetota bacterium]MDW8112814.1 hypothetical protein [Spirochaetia bacterium]
MKLLRVCFLLVVLLGYAYADDRERFYIGEELFLSGEYLKSLGVYATLSQTKLSGYETNVLNYRLSFFTNISEAIKILSNSNLPEARELLSFLLAYSGYDTTNLIDIINTKDERKVYKSLVNASNTGRMNIDFSIKLYFSMSNYRDTLVISTKDEFYQLKSKFIESLILKNLGREEDARVLSSDITSNYQNTFWGKVLLSSRKQDNANESNDPMASLEEGYYLIISKYNSVVRSSIESKNFKVRELDGKIYIGPYKVLLEAQRDGEKISRDYKVEVNLVQVRSQKF